MPERVEVLLFAFFLNDRLQNLTCNRICINQKSKFFKSGKLFSSPDYFNLQQTSEDNKETYISRKCRFVTSHGKKIIFDFGDILVISSFGLKGHWTWEQENNTGAVIEFENNVFAFYDDSLKQGNLSVVLTGSEEHKHIMKDVGPDITDESTTFEVFSDAMRNNRIKKRSISFFLMEQQRISGCGNYLRAEILYRSKIHPNKQLHHFTDEEIYIVFINFRNIVLEIYNCHGVADSNYKNMNGTPGTFVLSCYGRTLDPYNNQIETFKENGGRTIHWCPAIQINL